VKEEILHLKRYHYQNDDRQHTENTPSANFKSVEKQTLLVWMVLMELAAVSARDSTNKIISTDVQKTTSVKETNGLNLRSVSEYKPDSLNELENLCNLEVIPTPAVEKNNILSEEQKKSNLYLQSTNTNEQQTSQFYDIRADRTDCNFTAVDWRKNCKGSQSSFMQCEASAFRHRLHPMLTVAQYFSKHCGYQLQLHHIHCPTYTMSYIQLPKMTNQYRFGCLQPMHNHSEEGNCSACQNDGQLSTFDMAYT
jgi:hypothetical protein